jgi:hypothetical protein
LVQSRTVLRRKSILSAAFETETTGGKMDAVEGVTNKLAAYYCRWHVYMVATSLSLLIEMVAKY